MVGLSTAQAERDLKKYGHNVLPKKKGLSGLKILINQFKNPFSIVLSFAAVLSFLIGHSFDALLIVSIIVLNNLLSFWQEFKASKELEALGNMEILTARVLRDGKEVQIPTNELVPNDVVILEAGAKIPADGKLLESFNLQVNESILTGESLPVEKSTKEDQNYLFSGTTVISGRGRFLVLKTGAETRFGSIAKTLIQVKEEKTPLEESLFQFIKTLSILAIFISFGILIIRVIEGFELAEAFITSVAILAAAVPEGLAPAVTVILALAVRKMYLQKALVKKMAAVEALGTATVILSDKTGTLTKNEMRVSEVESYKDSLDELINCAVLCNSASLVIKEGKKDFDILGDNTEGALLIWANEKNNSAKSLRSEAKLLEEIPFTVESRKMTTTWEVGSKKVKYSKGAPEAIIPLTSLSRKEIETINKTYQKMASQGLRVLAFCEGKSFLGLVGIADEIRSEAKNSVEICKQAGIRVVMVTGDNELTAKTVAEKIGILNPEEEVLTGQQLADLSDEDLRLRLTKISVFARTTPEEKLRLVKAYQSLGETVAVTGDGVNDALALKQAQVGVAMGKSGTDISRETADLILLDDNFATLVSAVESGRAIFTNILKVVKFLLTGNFAEILLIAGASLIALPAPLLPTQILWINFVSDGLPAVALGFDKPSSNIMNVPPRENSKILNVNLIRYMIIGGGIIGLSCLLLFFLVYEKIGIHNARLATFSFMVVLQMILPFAIRRHHSIFSNKLLLLSTLTFTAIQALILIVGWQ